ncbi:hypothetical protein [Thalassotalea crassostreae]|uniref:hypothetical protein n=1 Tax=Thalassotalea crassostreae TaxID=1763536 RepID=UPI0008396ECC|nr:hypothetical protein [Thalassotalea crassostreae]
MKLLIHTGTHKTASSSIQNFLNINKTILAENFAIGYLSELTSLVVDDDFFNLLQISINDNKDQKILIVSNERLCGHFVDGYSAPETHALKLARAINNLTFTIDVEILTVFREQVDFIRSCYCQLLKQDNKISFPEFYRNLPSNSLNWKNYYDSFNQIITPRKYHIIYYSINMDIKKLITDILSIPMDKLSSPKTQINPSFGKFSIIMNEENRTFSKHWKSDKLSKILQITGNHLNSPKVAYFSDSESSEIRQFYKETDPLTSNFNYSTNQNPNEYKNELEEFIRQYTRIYLIQTKNEQRENERISKLLNSLRIRTDRLQDSFSTLWKQKHTQNLTIQSLKSELNKQALNNREMKKQLTLLQSQVNEFINKS